MSVNLGLSSAVNTWNEIISSVVSGGDGGVDDSRISGEFYWCRC